MNGKQFMTLTPTMERFIASWGEMTSKWCVNRAVAEVHAVFFLSADPLSAEEVADTLAFSRSNVSVGLRELAGRGLIGPVHVRGDRKQYYKAIKDPWEIFRIIVEDQRRRVIDRTVAVFRDCLDEQTREAPEDSYTADRMRDIVLFFETIGLLYNELQRLPTSPAENLLKATAKMAEVIG